MPIPKAYNSSEYHTPSRTIKSAQSLSAPLVVASCGARPLLLLGSGLPSPPFLSHDTSATDSGEHTAQQSSPQNGGGDGAVEMECHELLVDSDRPSDLGETPGPAMVLFSVGEGVRGSTRSSREGIGHASVGHALGLAATTGAWSSTGLPLPQPAACADVARRGDCLRCYIWKHSQSG